MPMARPYQPSLLRVLHGASALAVLGCWLSGLVVYSQYDGRWGRLAPVLPGDWIDIHGSLGVVLLPLAVLLAAYAFTLGWRRLQRPTNAIPLLALALAIGSGKLMQEDWLRTGQLHHLVYQLHLLAWLILALAVAAHLVGVLRRGGWRLAQSMLSLGTRNGDRPADWLAQLRRR
jgi:hypothetical protein